MKIITWIIWIITLIIAVINLIVLLISNNQKSKANSLINTILYFLISYILASQVLFI